MRHSNGMRPQPTARCMDAAAVPALEAPSAPIAAPPDPPRLIHGLRSTYRQSCRCTRCRAANSRYWHAWWSAKKTGRLPLGAHISAREAHRLIALLKRDWRSQRTLARGALARALGVSDLPRLTRQQRITLRTELKIRHLYRTRVLEDPDRRRPSAPDRPPEGAP